MVKFIIAISVLMDALHKACAVLVFAVYDLSVLCTGLDFCSVTVSVRSRCESSMVQFILQHVHIVSHFTEGGWGNVRNVFGIHVLLSE